LIEILLKLNEETGYPHPFYQSIISKLEKEKGDVTNEHDNESF
jgi:hypothetical protein